MVPHHRAPMPAVTQAPTATAPEAPDAKAPRHVALQALAVWGACLGAFVLMGFAAGWERFLNYLLLGLPQGCIIAMIAMGYSMVYGIILLINFAHGEIFMFSAFLTLALVVPQDWGDPRWVTAINIFSVFVGFTLAVTIHALTEDVIPSAGARLALAVVGGSVLGAGLRHLFGIHVPFFLALGIAAIVAPSFGIAMDRLAYRPLRNAPRLIPLITAIGVSLFLMNFAQLMFGPSDFRIPDEKLPVVLQPYFPDWSQPEPTGFWNILRETRTVRFTENLSLSVVDLIIVGMAVVMMSAVHAFIHHTRTGAAMRACALDQKMARLVGIDVNRTVAMAFGIGSLLAAVAAPFYVIKYVPVNNVMGYQVGILAFSSAVLGGIGNIRGAMLGGLLIGIVYNTVPMLGETASWPLFQWLASLEALKGVEDWNLFSGIGEWRMGVAYIFMILVLVFRPSGLLGKAEAGRRA